MRTKPITRKNFILILLSLMLVVSLMVAYFMPTKTADAAATFNTATKVDGSMLQDIGASTSSSNQVSVNASVNGVNNQRTDTGNAEAKWSYFPTRYIQLPNFGSFDLSEQLQNAAGAGGGINYPTNADGRLIGIERKAGAIGNGNPVYIVPNTNAGLEIAGQKDNHAWLEGDQGKGLYIRRPKQNNGKDYYKLAFYFTVAMPENAIQDGSTTLDISLDSKFWGDKQWDGYHDRIEAGISVWAINSINDTSLNAPFTTPNAPSNSMGIDHNKNSWVINDANSSGGIDRTAVNYDSSVAKQIVNHEIIRANGDKKDHTQAVRISDASIPENTRFLRFMICVENDKAGDGYSYADWDTQLLLHNFKITIKDYSEALTTAVTYPNNDENIWAKEKTIDVHVASNNASLTTQQIKDSLKFNFGSNDYTYEALKVNDTVTLTEDAVATNIESACTTTVTGRKELRTNSTLSFRLKMKIPTIAITVTTDALNGVSKALTVDIGNIKIDTVAPELISKEDVKFALNRKEINLNIKDKGNIEGLKSGIEEIRVKYPNDIVSTVQNNVFEAEENGDYTIIMIDKVGNIAEDVFKVFNIATFAPNITATQETGSITAVAKLDTYNNRITGLEAGSLSVSEVYNYGTEAKYTITAPEGTKISTNKPITIKTNVIKVNLTVDGVTEQVEINTVKKLVAENKEAQNKEFVGWFMNGTRISKDYEYDLFVNCSMNVTTKYVDKGLVRVEFSNFANSSILDVKYGESIDAVIAAENATPTINVPLIPNMKFNGWIKDGEVAHPDFTAQSTVKIKVVGDLPVEATDGTYNFVEGVLEVDYNKLVTFTAKEGNTWYLNDNGRKRELSFTNVYKFNAINDFVKEGITIYQSQANEKANASEIFVSTSTLENTQEVFTITGLFKDSAKFKQIGFLVTSDNLSETQFRLGTGNDRIMVLPVQSIKHGQIMLNLRKSNFNNNKVRIYTITSTPEGDVIEYSNFITLS